MNLKQTLTRILVLAILIMVINESNGESRNGKISLRVAELQNSKTTFMNVPLFIASATALNEKINLAVGRYTLLDIEQTGLNFILQNRPDFIKIKIPVNASVSKELLLYKVEISQNGFLLETSDGRRFSELNAIVNYRGVISGENNSVVGISFSKEETMGLVCNDEGNYVIGKIEDANVDGYIFYNDKDLFKQLNYSCGAITDAVGGADEPINQNNNGVGTQSIKCVNWYYEIDYDIFVGKGSLANVNSYIQGIFNQVATLYDNDGISISLQTVYVWTATDPYTGPNTSDYLNQFGAYRTSFAGDLANLVGYAGGGGIAYVNGLCSSSNAYKMGYMGISSSYNTVPTYSWTVEVVTHEDGHLLGSKHTHDCVWNGNNTRIDNCGPQAGYSSGTCAAGPMPTSGTIMSYCHLVGGVGINFNNGFGPQPTALILGKVNNATCLSACTSCPLPAQPGTISGATTYCGSSSQTYSVAVVSGATSYLWTLPSGWSGTSTSNSINVTASGSGGTLSVMAVNSCGNSTARTLTVTGSSVPSQPGNISGNTTVCQSSSQTYSITAVSGATSYTWTLPSGWSGSSTTNSITLGAGSAGGNILVAAVNACGSSAIRTLALVVNILPSTPLSITGQSSVCINTSYSYSVATVTGATSYSWTLPSGWSGTTTTNSINVVSGTTAGTISVSAQNSCGTSSASSLAITLGAGPSQPSAITGPASGMCSINGVSYSVTNVAGVSYTWSFSQSGASVASGQGTNAITSNFGSTNSAGTLSVTANNGCGISAARTLSITSIPAQPGTITGTSSPCINQQGVPYSITPVAGAATYTWTVPTGAKINDGTVTSTNTTLTTTAFNVTVNFKTKAGNVRVKANNACGSSTYRTKSTSFGCRISETTLHESFEVNVFPNPASDKFNITFHSNETSEYFIRLIDLSGKSIFIERGVSEQGVNNAEIQLDSYSPGIYFLEVINGSDRKVNKVSIQ